MIWKSVLLGLASILVTFAASPAMGAGPLQVSARVTTPGPHFVGQAIEVRVEVEGTSSPAEVVPPRLNEADAEIRPVPPGFVLVVRRPGTLLVPPFRVRSGERSASSRALRLSVEKPPAEGRPAAFLGGVGPFEVASEAGPTKLRLGGSLEYRLRLTGPAAWGSDRPPDLGGWGSIAKVVRVEPPSRLSEGGGSAVRTFRYRVRPARAGRLVLPPVPVAAFDPKSRRYATKVAPGLAIEVEAPPSFDPSGLDYGGERDLDVRRGWIWAGLGLGIAAVLGGMGGWWWARRKRSSRGVDPRRLAAGLAEGLGPGEDGDGPEAARRVVEALEAFLQEVGGRPPGALTPPEAESDVGRLTLDRDLPGRAKRLVEACDRARFGDVGEGAGGLVAEGRALLMRLGESACGVSAGGGPREAAETAKA